MFPSFLPRCPGETTMRNRLSLLALAIVIATAACSRAAEITTPAAPVHPTHTEAADDTTRRGGPGMFGGGN